MGIISIENLTKDYGKGRGVFDVSLRVEKGEIYGYLGPNGAGKSTTMRHLMGFSKADKGDIRILGMDCWREQKKIQEKVGYLPGEIAFLDDMKGSSYLKFIGKLRGQKDFSYAEELLEYFEIDPGSKIKRMSKGMKQKIGIVAAFMHKPEVILLDEPTSGLDPLMQNKFINLVEKEKQAGRTIILSSHIFEEVEKICDRVGMIKAGRLIKEVEVDELKHAKTKIFKIEFNAAANVDKIREAFPDSVKVRDNNQVVVSINDLQTNDLLRCLARCDVKFMKEIKQTLEDYFMQFYGGDKNV